MTRAEVSPDIALPRRSVAASKPRLGYRPALDGIRGIAIVAVMLTHAGLVTNLAGFIGVDVFFVLSGFLITALLVGEWDEFNRISLTQFYWRRALRLLPALLLMLACIAAFEWLTDTRRSALLTSGGALLALSYVSNWTDTLGYYQGQIFGHTWTLSIEEQFYLLWPLVIILLLRRASSRQSTIRFIFLAAFLAMVCRLALLYIGETEYRISRGTDTRADALLMGSVVGMMFASGLLPNRAWVKKLLGVLGLLVFVVVALIFLGFYQRFPGQFKINFIYGAVSFVTAILILHLVGSEAGRLNWILSRPWLVYVGKISYGLYLWHYPIFRLTQLKEFPRATELAIEMSLTLLMTLVSFHLLERPLLRYKNAFCYPTAGAPPCLQVAG